MTTKTRVLIESPFGRNTDGSQCTPEQYDRNTRYLYRAIRDSLERGEAPFASHALYPLVLDDPDQRQRRQGMESGFAWGECAQLIAVYADHGITPGMIEGIDRWENLGITVERRAIGREA